MFQGLKRLVYQVPDLDEAKHWYADILGQQPDYESPFGVNFTIGDHALSLMPGHIPLPDDSGRMAVYWEVEDVDAAYRRMLAAGAKPHTELRNFHGIRTAKVTDPFGNVLGLTGKIPDTCDQTVEGQPSQTAVGVAWYRAFSVYEDRPELKGTDHLAERFLSAEGRQALRNPASRAKIKSECVTSGRYGYILARTAFLDQLFDEAVREQIPQIVLLGAGYDTRAYRAAQLSPNTTIFELDAQPTQDRKREILRKANVAIPPQLRYVPVNFQKDRLKESLDRAGFDAGAKTFFVWEGVTYYLDAEAIDVTLQFVRDHTPAGSSIGFDYMTTERESAIVGEPFVFWLEKENVEPFLTQRGFQVREHLDADEIERRYLTLQDGTVAEKSMPHFSLVHAVVV
jgi:methyltransferase (TIGR00027 family)